MDGINLKYVVSVSLFKHHTVQIWYLRFYLTTGNPIDVEGSKEKLEKIYNDVNHRIGLFTVNSNNLEEWEAKVK